MKSLLIAFCLSVSAVKALAQGAGGPPPVPAEIPKQPASFVADGSSAVEIPEAGFKIVPPAGWEVIPGGSGARLLFQAPKPADVPGVFTLRPSMRVMMFDEAVPMDDATKDLYYKKIVEGNSNASSAISNYMIRSADAIKLANGMDAYLYYAEYTHSTVPTMQMHVLVSTAHKHFIMTYTDLASVFENQGAGLTTAYTSMQGVTLDSAPPERFTTMIYIGSAIVLVLLLLVTMRVVRGYRMKKLGERIESEDGGDATTDDDNDYSRSGVSAISEVAESHDHDDDYEMPETQEAPARRAETPAPAPKKAAPAPAPKAPAPAPKPAPVVAKEKPVAPKPEPVKAPVPAPTPAPAPAAFEARTRKTTVSSEVTPPPHVSAVSESDAPTSSAWNLSESDDHNDDNDFETSDVSELKSKPVIAPATKSKHQKAPAPARMEVDMDGDVSKVARLSEILPNTGDSKKKKKGFFGWGKKTEEEDDQIESPMHDNAELDGEDDWDNSSKKKSKDKGPTPKAKTVAQAKPVSAVAAQPVSQVSEIADGWNLSEGHGDHDSEDEED
jgi:hypothetical protein